MFIRLSTAFSGGPWFDLKRGVVHNTAVPDEGPCSLIQFAYRFSRILGVPDGIGTRVTAMKSGYWRKLQGLLRELRTSKSSLLTCILSALELALVCTHFRQLAGFFLQRPEGSRCSSAESAEARS